MFSPPFLFCDRISVKNKREWGGKEETMQYRDFRGEKVSLLGLGCMRLPSEKGDKKKIDEEKAIALIRSAIDQGINYLDTAYVYQDGMSEKVLGKALKDGYRGKVFVADKMPVWLVKQGKTYEELFQTHLDRLEIDYIDMYLMHSLDQKIWKVAKESNLLEFMLKKKEEGKIRYIGFSFHDDLKLFQEILDSYSWDFCQIQLNYMDVNYQAGVAGLKSAHQKGIPVVVMEPLRGGRLTDRVPEEVQAIWDGAAQKRSPAEWALRWVADFPEVTTILSGMGTPAQLEENIRVLGEVRAESMTSEEKEMIERVAEEYRKRIKAPCTGCEYCLPCPQKLRIPELIENYNEWFLYEGNEICRSHYYMVPKGKRPSDCIGCMECEERCPQHLPIRAIMLESKEIFEG